MKNLLIRSVMVCLFAFIPAALAQSENALAGTRWELDGAPAVASATLEFLDASQVTGSGGCNRYGGSYAIEGDTITFSEIASTLMLCADEAVGQQETAFFEALGSATRYELTDEGLTIWYGDDRELRFVAGKTLVGTQWRLESLGETAVVAGSVVTLTFGADNTVMGSGGCNNFSGTYMLNGDGVTFSPLVSTKMACAGISQQEAAFFEALGSATRYELTDEGLTIWYGDGQELHFVATLAGTQWQLQSIGETPVVAESIVTLTLGTDNTVMGSGGCNSFSGTYETDADAITFSPLMSTMMACLDSGISDQEATFFEALGAATRYEISGDQLTLWTGNTQALAFVAMAGDAASG
jgi:heat shock protein HslJ